MGFMRVLMRFLLIGVILHSTPLYAQPIRTVEVSEGQVIPINTAIGYSTILEFSSKPISAVLGDQDSFKLEYVANSITIKPLMARARSNLFVFTEFDRFNCKLNTVTGTGVDFIVRIKLKEKSYPVERANSPAVLPPVTKMMNRVKTVDGFSLQLHSVTKDREISLPRSVTLIDFEISSQKATYSFQPSSIGVKQLGKFLTIESLYLDSLEISPDSQSVHGKLALLSRDFKPGRAVLLVFAIPDSKFIAVSTEQKPTTKGLKANVKKGK